MSTSLRIASAFSASVTAWLVVMAAHPLAWLIHSVTRSSPARPSSMELAVQ